MLTLDWNAEGWPARGGYWVMESEGKKEGPWRGSGWNDNDGGVKGWRMSVPSGIDLWRPKLPRAAASCRCRWQSGMSSQYRSTAASLNAHKRRKQGNIKISADVRSPRPLNNTSSENDWWQHFQKYDSTVLAELTTRILSSFQSPLVDNSVRLVHRFEPQSFTLLQHFYESTWNQTELALRVLKDISMLPRSHILY